MSQLRALRPLLDWLNETHPGTSASDVPYTIRYQGLCFATCITITISTAEPIRKRGQKQPKAGPRKLTSSETSESESDEPSQSEPTQSDVESDERFKRAARRAHRRQGP